MKKNLFYYLFAVICTVCLFTACSDDDDKSSLSSKIELSSNESEAVLAKPAEGATAITFDIKFTATGEWKAKTSHGWLSLDKKRGTAGEHTILVTVKENKEVSADLINRMFDYNQKLKLNPAQFFTVVKH